MLVLGLLDVGSHAARGGDRTTIEITTIEQRGAARASMHHRAGPRHRLREVHPVRRTPRSVFAAGEAGGVAWSEMTTYGLPRSRRRSVVRLRLTTGPGRASRGRREPAAFGRPNIALGVLLSVGHCPGHWGCPGGRLEDVSLPRRRLLYLRGRRGVGGDLRAYRAFRCVQRIHARSSRSRWHRPPAAGALCFHAVPIPADNTDEPRPDGIEPMRQPGAPSEPPRTWSCIRPCGNFCTMPSPPRLNSISSGCREPVSE